jgi:hypothetical protein
MTLTFENDPDVFVYTLEKIIALARREQYIFVANCVWWIAGVIGLDQGLITFIDNLESRKEIVDIRAISETPRDIARSVSPDKQESTYTPDPLRRTRIGRINPLPQSKNQLRIARKAKFLENQRK